MEYWRRLKDMLEWDRLGCLGFFFEWMNLFFLFAGVVS